MLFSLLLQVQDTPPDIVLFFGRFHPMILHLPIGILILAFLFEVLSRFDKYKSLKGAIPTTLLLGGILAVITSILGLMLSQEGGYGEPILSYHKWLGLSTTLLAFVTFYLSRKENLRKFYFGSLLLLMGTLTVGGHFGGTLTHGEDYLTEYLPGSNNTANPLAELESIDEAEIYNHLIQPVFEDKCVSCHNPVKKKGELLLTDRENILKGGESGSIFEAGNAAESSIFKLISLPEDHDDHMPPEGKRQLSTDEISLIEFWIESGASFDNRVADVEVPEGTRNLLEKMLEEHQKITNPVYSMNVDEADESDLIAAKQEGVTVRRVSRNTNFVQAKLTGDPAGLMKALKPFKSQLIWLDLSNTEVTDADLSGLGQYSNLTRLHLNQTSISDVIMAEIGQLSHLEYINLHSTDVSNEGVKSLAGLQYLKSIYVWQTQITSDQMESLRSSNPEFKFVGGTADGSIDTIRLASPLVEAERNIFRVSTTVTAELRFEGVKLFYTLDGSDPSQSSNLYDGPITIDKSCELKIVAFKEGWRESLPTVVTLSKVESVPESIQLANAPSDRYKGSGSGTLIDLVKGTENFRDGKWLGFDGADLEATVDMGDTRSISYVRVSTLIDIGSYIFGPSAIQVETSEDGKNFTAQGNLNPGVPSKAIPGGLKTYSIPIKGEARFIRLSVKNVGKCPPWHPGNGSNAWLFVDEIIIE